MKRTLLTILLCSPLVLSLGAALSAQNPGGQAPPEPRAPGSTFSLRFDGGSVRDYIELIRGTVGDAVNIVTDEDADGAMLPPMSLKNVRVDVALKVMQGIAKSDVKVAVTNLTDGGTDAEVYIVRVVLQPKAKVQPGALIPGAGGGLPLPIGGLAASPGSGLLGGSPTPASLPTPKRLEIISLARRLRDEDPDISAERVDQHLKNILTAIDAAMTLESDAGQSQDHPLVKYHAETGLLMVRGTDTQIEVVQRILTEMVPGGFSGSKPSDPFQDPRVVAQISELRKELELLQSEIVSLKLELKKSLELEDSRPKEPDAPKPKKFPAK